MLSLKGALNDGYYYFNKKYRLLMHLLYNILKSMMIWLNFLNGGSIHHYTYKNISVIINSVHSSVYYSSLNAKIVRFPLLLHSRGPITIIIPPNTFTTSKILYILIGLKMYINSGLLTHLHNCLEMQILSSFHRWGNTLKRLDDLPRSHK